MTLKEYFQSKRRLVDQWLDRLLPPESTPPRHIHQAMRYSVFAGGKRLRPILTIATGEAFAAPAEAALRVASALEMIHTYSLIHDDLPAMDDDDFRRGKPTCHKVFGEAVAILAGDGLHALAFKVLADLRLEPHRVARKIRLISETATAVGTVGGMVAGQVMDILAEGETIPAATLEEMDRAKTGALIRASVRAGGLLGDATEEELQQLTRYADAIGLAFQIVDDLLDLTATTEQLGKTAGKDVAAGKATYPALYGMEGARLRATQLVQTAVIDVARLDRDTERLQEIARFILDRAS